MRSLDSKQTKLPLTVSKWFRVLFHSPSGVLFTFPSRYSSTIGRRVVFSLGRWSSQLHAKFLVFDATPGPNPRASSFQIRGYHPLRPPFQYASPKRKTLNGSTHTPNRYTIWFGLLPLRSPLLRESKIFSTPPVTEMFHFTGLALTTLL